MIQNPEITAEIVGHTSRKGASEYNQTLSEQRALGVYNEIIDVTKSLGYTDEQVDNLRDRLTYKGLGETNARNNGKAEDNDDLEDRRTEVNFLTTTNR